MNEMKIEEPHAFEAKFRFEVDGDLGSEAAVEIPSPPTDRSRPLLVRFIPDGGASWVGRFWGGGERGVTGVTTWPDSGVACVIVSGVAYRGPVADPGSWKELAPEPTKAVLAFPKHGRIVFSDPWNLYAYGKEHEVWRIRGVALDGFEVAKRGADVIRVEVERDTGDVERLRVDVATGAVQRVEG